MIFALTHAVQTRIRKDSKEALMAKRTMPRLFEQEEWDSEVLKEIRNQVKATEQLEFADLEMWLEKDQGSREKLHTIPIYPEAEDQVHSSVDLWFANIRLIHRRNVLIFTHDVSGLTFAVQLGAYKFSHGITSLLELFYLCLRRFGFSDSMILAYFTASPLHAFTNTGAPRRRDRMRAFLECSPILELPESSKPTILNESNRYHAFSSVKPFFNDKIWRITNAEAFKLFYHSLTGEALELAFPAWTMKIQLIDPSDDTLLAPWRELTVPQATDLHYVSFAIMAAFNLWNYHNTAFEIQGLADHDLKVRYLLDEEISDNSFLEVAYPDDEYQIERQEDAPAAILVKANDQVMHWEYDYGDGFVYLISDVRESTMESLGCEVNAGEGEAPPTDVGGYGGYERFLEALETPEDPESAELLMWAVELVGWQPFSLENTKRFIEYTDPMSNIPQNRSVEGWVSRYVPEDSLTQLGVPQDLQDQMDAPEDSL